MSDDVTRGGGRAELTRLGGIDRKGLGTKGKTLGWVKKSTLVGGGVLGPDGWPQAEVRKLVGLGGSRSEV
jgi:hypothetical protein